MQEIYDEGCDSSTTTCRDRMVPETANLLSKKAASLAISQLFERRFRLTTICQTSAFGFATIGFTWSCDC